MLIEGITPSGKKKAANVNENGDLIVAGQTQVQASGGITQSQVQAAIQAATNLDGIEQGLANLLEEGTPIGGESLETGGSKALGWLSSIRKLISDRLTKGSNTVDNALTVTLANNGIFAVFAGLASDAASIAGSIHAKLRAIAEVSYSNWNRLQNATDLVITYTYLDDERFDEITYSSASLGVFAKEKYTYTGSPGAYRPSSVVRS